MTHSHNHAGCHKGDFGHHDHAAHADLDTADGRRRVAIAGIVTALFVVVEAIGGIISGSLALLADAAHMFTDAASLALAWLGYVFAARPADDTRPFGFGRMRVLAAFINGLTLLALSAWIVFEGVQRMLDPQPIHGSIMLWVAVAGLAVNLVSAKVLHGGDKNDINLSGALWHVIGDLLGSVAAILASIVIIFTNWTLIDPILSILVAILVFVAGIRITKRAGHILAQGAPEHLTPSTIRSTLNKHIEGISEVVNIHVWQLTEDKSVVTVELKAADNISTESLRQGVKQHLINQLHVHLATVEIVQNTEGDNFIATT